MDAVEKEVWKPSTKPVFDLLRQFGFDVDALEIYENLDTLRLVVNVFKHGKGSSLLQLKERQPDYFNDGDIVTLLDHKDHNDLEISMSQFNELADSIRSFWNQFPNCLHLEL